MATHLRVEWQVLDAMPEISRFHGMVIRMFVNDHAPPHFHVRAGLLEARVGISPPVLLSGHLRGRHLALVMQWASLHEAELLANWERLRAGEPACRIRPLE